MANMQMILVRHTKPMIFHFPIRLEGQALKAAKASDLKFDDLGRCRIVFGSSMDETIAATNDKVYPPEVTMPTVVWEALQKHEGYAKTIAALEESGELMPMHR